jgi:hypothetical protein
MSTRLGSTKFVLPLVAALLALGGLGCDQPGSIDIPEAGATDGGPGDDAAQSFNDSGIGVGSLTIMRLVPNHGPFIGGNLSILRGAGFDDMSQVTFDSHMVQPADHTLIDARRLQVVVPAGEVGTVDVSVTVGDETFTLTDGYTYDGLSVDPNRGSVAGGTFVNIVGAGTAFAEGDTVLFGRTPCTDLTIVSSTRITCRTPATSAGTVDVVVVHAADSTETLAVDAYTYYDTADPFSGGLGGGPADGTINVTVIDAGSGLPVEGAFAIVGEDLSTIHQGLTDALGQITFSGDDLVGQNTVHIAKHCYERTSVIAFDAQNVTVFLVPWQDPMCGMGMPSGGGRGRNGAFIAGDLVWNGPLEYAANPWDNIPAVRDGWVRVAYVYTTQADVDQPNPDPALGGSMQRVVETEPPADRRGYPYMIFARPAGLAVYALAGLENTMTGQFVPYVMGVTRSVLASPGETTSGVDIIMDIPLDHTLQTQLGALPAQVDGQPDRFWLRAFMDLGGEGVIVRNVNGTDFDSIRRRDMSRDFTFVGEPALQGTLEDGRYRVMAGYTSDYDGPPYTFVIENGVTAVDEIVVLPDFLGIPDATSPADGERIPEDRVLRWQEVDGPTPSFHIVLMVGGDGNPAWRMFLPGDITEAPIPDLSSIPMIEDISGGYITWVVYAITIPGFEFDTFTYNHLNQRYWSHYSYNYFLSEI